MQHVLQHFFLAIKDMIHPVAPNDHKSVLKR